jgi:hypothetical protein
MYFLSKIYLRGFALTVGLLYSGIGFTQTDWKLEKNKNNILVYTRFISGSSYKEFKAVKTIKSTLSGVVALFNDASAFTQWIDGCIEATTLKKISDTENYGYYVSYAPWPVTNRDMITHAVITQDSITKMVTVELNGSPDYVPEKSGLVRIEKLKGCWKFFPRGNGLVEVTYQLHVELGGNVPAWLANSFAVDNPFNTLMNVDEIIKKDKYQLAVYKYIREK